MGNRQRLGLIAAALVIAVVGFLALRPDDGDEMADDPGPRVARTETAAQPAPQETPTATAESALPPPPEEIVLNGGTPEGGVARIEVERGELVRLVVASDRRDEIHVHGYDLTRVAAPGEPARFRFRADAEGQFEIESHAAEDAGQQPLIANLVVQPKS